MSVASCGKQQFPELRELAQSAITTILRMDTGERDFWILLQCFSC